MKILKCAKVLSDKISWQGFGDCIASSNGKDYPSRAEDGVLLSYQIATAGGLAIKDASGHHANLGQMLLRVRAGDGSNFGHAHCL